MVPDPYQAAAFNVKAVVKETGQKADTLRAWERRYGLPEPDRTEGGHRRYSRRDIETIKWLVARQEEGLSISSAVDLWRDIKEEGSDPLQHPRYRLHRMGGSELKLDGRQLDEVRGAWVDACLDYDEARANRVLEQAFAMAPAEKLVNDVLRAGVAEIGTNWYRSEAVVQQEHFATELASRRLHALLNAAPPASRSKRILLACPPQEEHSFGLLVLAVLLRRLGWPVIFLGANVPQQELARTLEHVQPQLVVSAAQGLYAAASLRDVAIELNELSIPLAYGGRFFRQAPSSREKVPGHYLGDQIELAPARIEDLLAASQPEVHVQQIDPQYQRSLRTFQRLRRQIEADVIQAVADHFVAPKELGSINEHFAHAIIGALKFGDLALLEQEIKWTSGLLSARGLNGPALEDYLGAYHAALQERLPPSDNVLLSWLGDQT